MNAKEKKEELLNKALLIAQHYTFPHAEYGLAKEISLLIVKESRNYCDLHLKGWLDSDINSFWDEVEKELNQ
ncbi:hypothetical protein UFOVP386_8 [uncultured Caudovirales phage]|uniref:Uncharacterized protein n=1 Tax=uncultured Caudovirales phage TaxID=2100421 RepID=A0A6J7X0J1_9CAUD|nr:hypothetical protein UFOVP386_8 [uncultured Caudovirales phage]